MKKFKSSICYTAILSNLNINFDLSDLADSFFPVRFLGQHLKKDKPLKFNFYTIVQTYLFATGYFIKSLISNTFSSSNIITDFDKIDFLLFVPNSKYERFAKEFIIKLPNKKKYLIISTHELSHLSSIQINKIKISNSHIIFSYFILFKYLTTTLLKNISIFKKTSRNIIPINKLIIATLRLSKLFDKFHFKIYFSFAPSIDQHQIIENLFRKNFSNTYAIRPDGSNYTDSHLAIKTSVLFYKSEYEKEIYLYYKLDQRFKLLPGGALLNSDNRTKTKNTDLKIVLIDTCKTSNSDRNESHINFLNDLYALAKEKKITIHHKLHPSEPNDVLNLINPHINNGFCKLINDNLFEEVLNSKSIFISFNSTLIYDVILKKRPVFIVSKFYNKSIYDENEFRNSSIPRIENYEGLEKSLNYLLDNSNFDSIIKNTEESNKWFIENYNLKSGINRMIDVMLDNK